MVTFVNCQRKSLFWLEYGDFCELPEKEVFGVGVLFIIVFFFVKRKFGLVRIKKV
jgi:hypothetical protein